MQRNVIFKGKSIHYKTEGTGKPIILLHGFLESLEMWNDFTKSLLHKFTVIRIDLPGFGNSETISSVHTMELMADTVKAVMDHEEIKAAVIVGHSMGGYASLAFAEKYPEKLKGLCLFHSHAAADTNEAMKNRERTIEIVEKNHIGFISNFIPDLFAPENVKKFEKEIDLLKTNGIKTSRKGVIAALMGMKTRTSKLGLLNKTNVPVLFIAGKKDKRIPANTIMEQALLPYHSEVLLLGNVGHMGYIEARNETLESLQCFAKKCF